MLEEKTKLEEKTSHYVCYVMFTGVTVGAVSSQREDINHESIDEIIRSGPLPPLIVRL